MTHDPIIPWRWCSAWYYSRLAQRHISSMEASIARQTELERGGQLSREELNDASPEIKAAMDHGTDAAVSAIVFAGMAVEAYIYDYSARNLGKAFTDNHVDKLSVESKWVVIPKLVTGKPFPKEGRGFQLLKGLIKTRNALVHSKSRNVRISELSEDAVRSREDLLWQNARDAVRAISLLAGEIEKLHTGEMAKFHLGLSLTPE